MKLHKKTFEIKVFTPFVDGTQKETVTGLCSDSFGMHKTDDDLYTVSHLKSGLKIMGFTLAVQARDFIDRMEKAVFPVSWESTTSIKRLTKNRDKVFELRDLSNKVRPK